jgi:SAM-dependent methyltransferase
VDLASLAWLRSPPGHALLHELADLREADLLPTLTRLRQQYDPAHARAAVDLALLRQRAAARFPQAARLYFTREALEQATSAAVAAQRARRFAPYAHVADVCCGLGGDALALAAAGCHVTAVDRDPLRLALAAANAEVLGLRARLALVQADVLREPPPAAEALFCDPGRRAGGRRRFAVADYEPPLAHVLQWRQQTPDLAVKLAPGVDTSELAALAHLAGAYELEFVSLAGELKEATLWCGALAGVQRRATLLADAQPGRVPLTLTDAPAVPAPPLHPPARLLYEPDPAVLRAGLVAQLAAQLGAAQLDASIAYLTADQLVPTPFARAWQIHEWLPFNLKRLRARLRAYNAGVVTVKKRGSPLDTDALARQLRGRGDTPLVVVLTQVQGQPAALLCSELAR